MAERPGTAVQLALFLLLVGLVLVFIKMNSYEKRLKEIEDSARNYVLYEDYMELFTNMWKAAERGEDTAPFSDVSVRPS